MKGETSHRLERFFGVEGPLSELLGNYDPRPEQTRMAAAVAEVLERRDVLLADAPTGTGKSLAYLAPPLLEGKRLVVSTATIALQHQLLGKDLPLVRAAVAKLLGYPEDEGFTYALLKGRSNFLCEQRYEETVAAGNLLREDLLESLARWRHATTTGDREEVDFPLPLSRWVEVASDGEDCTPGSCPHREGCFYYAARDRAKEADVLVVNHALLLANAVSWGNIFEVGDRHLVIDEAHRLEEVMSAAFGARVTRARVGYVARQVTKKAPRLAEHTEEVENAADLFFEALGSEQRLGEERHAPAGYRRLLDSLRSLRERVASDTREEVVNLQGMVGRLRRDLASFYEDASEAHAAAVVPGRSRGDARLPLPELRSWLMDTGDAFREEVLGLFDGGGVVLTSATLAAGSIADRSFAYVRERLGLDGELSGRTVDEVACSETFDYERRCLIYLPDDLPLPDRHRIEAYNHRAAARARELIERCGGRALVLLTTTRAVKDFRQHLNSPYPTRFQGEDSPSRLVRWMKETEGAVLVGTRTFWEGVDLPGSDVSLVVIDRAPFPAPDDPVVRALTERAGKGWFAQVSLPRAQVAMRQGAGRLLRTATDRGVVAILDPRMRSRGWGKVILSGLPPAPVTDSLEEVGRFLGRSGREAPPELR